MGRILVLVLSRFLLARLARFLRKTKGPNEVEEEVLSDYVSSSCFLLQVPAGCMEGEEEHPK